MTAPALAIASDTAPPVATLEVAGAWPGDQALSYDLLVPITLTVRADGGAEDMVADATSAPALAAAALAAAAQWRFSPARKDGEPVAARIRVAVRFVGAPAPRPTPAPAPATPPTDPTPPADDEAVLNAMVRGERPPASASEVTRDRATLTAAPHRSADELLYVVPGVFITQHSGEGKAHQIFYRGFDAVHGQDMEIWAGGAPINDVSNIHGQGYADLNFLPVEVVRELRVTPGAYDPRQGDFAVAGTLRFDLGYDQPGFTGKAEVGSFGTRRYFLAYRPQAAPEATFAAAEFRSTAGFGPSRAAERASAIAQMVHPLGADTMLRVLLSAYTGRFSSAGVLRLRDIEAGAVDRFGVYDPSQGGASSRTQVVTELTRQDETSAFGLAGYLVLRSLLLRHNFTGFLTDPNGDLQQQVNDDLAAGATGFYRLRIPLLSSRDSLEVGFAARTDWIEQSQKRLAVVDNRVTADEVDARVRAHDVAGYFDLSLFPHPRVGVRGGLRVDGLGYSSQDTGSRAAGQSRASQGKHLGKKATIDVRIRSGLHALVSYGEGFRSPQARSLADGEPTPFTRVTSYEAGLRLAHGWANASLAGFRTSLSDDLVFDQATVRNERVPATRRTGVTADVTVVPARWLNAAVSATFTRATFTAADSERAIGDLLPYVPQLVVRSDVSVRPPLGRLRGRAVEGRLGAGFSLLARRPLPYRAWGHDIALVDAAAGVRVGAIEVGIDAFNLLDAGWYDGEFVYASRFNPSEATSLLPQRHVTVGAPRTVLFSLTLSL